MCLFSVQSVLILIGPLLLALLLILLLLVLYWMFGGDWLIPSCDRMCQSSIQSVVDYIAGLRDSKILLNAASASEGSCFSHNCFRCIYFTTCLLLIKWDAEGLNEMRNTDAIYTCIYRPMTICYPNTYWQRKKTLKVISSIWHKSLLLHIHLIILLYQSIQLYMRRNSLYKPFGFAVGLLYLWLRRGVVSC